MHNPLSVSSKRSTFLDQFGQALLRAAMVLPVAAILVVAGDLLSRAGVTFAPILADAGFELIGALPLLIAVSTAVSLSAGQSASAALTGVAVLLVLNRTAAAFLIFMNKDSQGFAPLNMGLLAGVIAGLTVGLLGAALDRINLPGHLRGFRVSRLLPVAGVAVAFVEGIACGAVWTYLQRGLAVLAARLPGSGAAGAFAYGFLNRLLLPFGLHHVLNQEIWTKYGEFTDQSGNLVLGDLSRFLAGDPTAGRTIAGFYEMMIFALPAVAICLILSSRPWRRGKSVILMTVAGFSALISGISEPLELLVLFTSPVLYVLLALLYGLSQLLSLQLGIHSGFSFSTGLTDLLSHWDQADNPDRIWQIGLVMAGLAFGVFYLAIRFLKLPAPGRERGSAEEELAASINVTTIPASDVDSIPRENDVETSVEGGESADGP